MAEKKHLPDGSSVDMQDPESIRAYVRHALAMHEPSIAGLKRLEMLLEVADSLPAPAEQKQGKLVLIDAARAAEVLAERLGNK